MLGLSASLASQNLRCLRRFACADHTTVPSAVTALRLADLVSPRGNHLWKIHGYIVPGALHHSITAIAQPGREPLVGQRVTFPSPP